MRPGQGRVVGVIGAAGGAGATVLAAATASLGADRVPTVLVDLDPVGAGVERVLGYEDPSVTTWRTLGTRTLSPRGLREALPRHDGVHLIGFGAGPGRPIEAEAVSSVLSACVEAFGLTVVDIPRSLTASTRLAIERCDLVVIASPQSIGATLAGQRLVLSLQPGAVEVVVRSGPRALAPDAVADAFGLPLLAAIADQRSLDEALAVGMGPLRSRGTGLRIAATAVLDHLKIGI